MKPEEAIAASRSSELGLTARQHGRRLVLLLKEEITLENLVQMLSGTSIRSISLRPVTLEDVYFDATSLPLVAPNSFRGEEWSH